MTTRNASGATITLTDLARLAGVGRNAVSNWRRREPDFPAPVDDSTRRPRFSLAALEDWAAAHGRELRVTGADRAWFAISGEHPTAEAALGAVAAAFDDPDELGALESEMSAAELFEFFIERAREAAGTGTGPGIGPLADLAAEVARGSQAPADPAQGAETPTNSAAATRVLTVHDPACEEGDLLAAVAARVGPCRELSGTDLSAPRTAIAARRLGLLDEDADVEVRVGDSLLDPLPPERYSLVVCDPPFNVKDWGYDRLPAGDDPRLAFGTPPRTEPELAWALHCVALLAPGGHAVVRMPAQVAHRRTGRRIRSELLRWGALRAVVDHPDAKAHLWILTPRGETSHLLVSNGRGFAAAWRTFTAAPETPMATPDAATVPLMRLWDEDVDISPAVYLASTAAGGANLAESVAGLGEALAAIGETALPRFGSGAEESAPETSLADLERDGHLTVSPGGAEGKGRCAIVDPLGTPQVRLGDLADATETQWTVECGESIDLGWIAANLAARLPGAAKRTATGAKRRILAVKIPRLPLAQQRKRGEAFAALEDLRSALALASDSAGALAVEAATGLVAGTVSVED
ncbi:N-6 DNA methylase [Glycomyces sp. NPDC046736]|uniref:N-6 DNA methylase n=1 Tax=Glycomyces sp. NPDC046736 TaxID=3155615 RepID=UPI0033EB7736